MDLVPDSRAEIAPRACSSFTCSLAASSPSRKVLALYLAEARRLVLSGGMDEACGDDQMNFFIRSSDKIKSLDVIPDLQPEVA